MTTGPEPLLQAFLVEEPRLRALARALVGSGADEVVQRTWLQAMRASGAVREPRGFLHRLCENIARNLARGERRRRRREHDRAIAADATVPSSAELLLREERRRELIAAVDALPSPHRDVVWLRWFEGLPPRAIAERLALPAATVWDLHRRALERLRRQLGADDEQRRRALLPLTGALPLAATAATLTGTIAMTTTKKIAAGVAAALLLTLLVIWPDAPRDALPARPAPGDTQIATATAATADASPAANDVRRAVVESPPSTAEAATTGDLRVRVWFPGEPREPAAGVVVTLRGRDDVWLGTRRRTDERGEVAFAGLAPGRAVVWTDRDHRPRRADVGAGHETILDVELEPGITVSGRVVDADGQPVAGAEVEVGEPGIQNALPEVMAITAVGGTFTVRGVEAPVVLVARAAGHRASAPVQAYAADGQRAEVELRLRPDGGTIDGIVVDPQGRPVPAAMVWLGAGGRTIPMQTTADPPPHAQLVHSDDDGRFTAVGLDPGEQPVAARAGGFALWRGICIVTAHTSTQLRVELGPGATVRGVAIAPDGTPASRAEVRFADWEDFDSTLVLTGTDGAFEMRGLPAGEIVLRAEHDDHGKGEVAVQTHAGRTSTCELRLSRGLELRGRVVDADGAPVAKAFVHAEATVDGRSWGGNDTSDADGRFAIANCPAALLEVDVAGAAIEPLRRTGVDAAGELLLTVRRRGAATASIRGRVVGDDGAPITGAIVSAVLDDRGAATGVPTIEQKTSGTDGSFALEGLVAGRWRLDLMHHERPGLQLPPRTLADGERQQLGDLRMPAGGRGRVRGMSESAPGLWLMVERSDDGRLWGMTDRTTPWLEPGDYRLLVAADDRAAQAVPFTIGAGLTTEIDVPLRHGAPQRIAFAPADGAAPLTGVQVEVFTGMQRVYWRYLDAIGVSAEPVTIHLAPGTWRIRASNRGRAGETTIVVAAAQELPDVRIELR